MRTSTRTLACKGIAVFVGACITIFFLQLLDRRSPVTLFPRLATILPNPAPPGSLISITWTVRAERACAGEIIPRVIDSGGIVHEYAHIPTVYHAIMDGNPGTFTKQIQLPNVIMAGPARYEAVVIRWCNQVQHWLWPIIDPPFPIHFEISP